VNKAQGAQLSLFGKEGAGERTIVPFEKGQSARRTMVTIPESRGTDELTGIPW